MTALKAISNFVQPRSGKKQCSDCMLTRLRVSSRRVMRDRIKSSVVTRAFLAGIKDDKQVASKESEQNDRHVRLDKFAALTEEI